MRAGCAALCSGTVRHRRLHPTEHEFDYPTAHVWIDPDRPQDICDLSRLWSEQRPAAVRFRRDDYGNGGTEPLGEQVRRDLDDCLGYRPTGPVRMVSQLRRWGWLFNPITIFLAWGDDPDVPIGAVLEVTNTPWKERHRYAVALSAVDDHWRAEFRKQLHVSPFLGAEFDYRLSIADRDDRFVASIDVLDPSGSPTLSTLLDTTRRPATPRTVARSTFTPIAPTHRVSLGIHVQALRLWLKRVPFVPHHRGSLQESPSHDRH